MSRVRPGVSDKSAPRVRDLLWSARSHLRLRADSRVDFALANREAAAQPVALSRIAAGRFRGRARNRPALRLYAAGALQAPRRRTRAQASLYKGRHRQSSDAVVQGPRRVGFDRQGARVRLHHRVVRFDRQPCDRGRGARGARGTAMLHLHARRRGGGKNRRLDDLRRARHHDSRQLRRREPAVQRNRGQVRVGLRQYQPAAVLHRGREDFRLRSGGAAWLAPARSHCSADRGRNDSAENRQGV